MDRSLVTIYLILAILFTDQYLGPYSSSQTRTLHRFSQLEGDHRRDQTDAYPRRTGHDGIRLGDEQYLQQQRRSLD